MKLQRVLKSVFPAPRRPVGLLSFLVPAAYILGFLVIWFSLELSGLILFSNNAALWGLVLFPWFWWMHRGSCSGLSPGRAGVALFVRLSLAGLLIMILAEPRAVRESDDLSVIYVLDISDSIGEGAVDSSLSYILKTSSQRPERDRTGLIVFGRDAAVELPPRIDFPFETINSRIVKDGSNLEKALRLALAVVPDDTSARVVLISDGAVTEGNVSGVLSEYTAENIPVNVLPVQYDFPDEVWLEKLDLPKTVKKGETYEASIVLDSLNDGSGDLVLEENGREIYRDQVSYKSGKNRYTLPIYLREPGFYEYRAVIRPPRGRDGWEKNNVAINYLYLKGEGKVLVVQNPFAKTDDFGLFIKALREAGRSVEKINPFELPHDSLTLMEYDCLVMADVPADAFDYPQLQSFKEAVYNQGMGLIMIGGENSFGPGGYHRTPVEEALPVDMDVTQKKVLPKGALVIILHTCEFPEGNTWGKRIAKEAMRVLGAQDEVGILVYDWSNNGTGEKWLFPLTPASQYETLVTLVNKAQIGDMPSFSSTMKMGLTGLKASDAAMKHMIIISDGDPSPPTPRTLKAFKDEKISISTISIFPHGGQEVMIMKSIAQMTGGRYYAPKDPSLLPAIFVKEAKTLKRSMIQNVVFTPTVENPSPILKGIDSVPELKGYVLTSPKPRSSVILKGPEEEQIDPVLSTWRFGLGKSAAFTSDFSRNWGASWIGWNHFRAFVKQLITDISKVTKKSKLYLTSYVSGEKGMLLVEDYAPQRTILEVHAAVTGPRDKMETLRLKQTSPGRYEGEFPLWGKGRYQVMISGEGGQRSEQVLGGFAVPYSPEYLRFRSDPRILRMIAGKTGGKIFDGSEKPEDIFVRERESRRSSKPVFDLFLMVLACLIPLDVAVRRIQIDMDVIKRIFSLGKGKGDRPETLGALLRVKQRVSRSTEKEESFIPRVMKKPPVNPVLPRQKPEEPKEKMKKSPESDSQGQGTMGQLLAAKRKRQENKDSDQ